MKNKLINISLILIFFLIILAPTFYTKFNLQTPFVINENRVLQKPPAVKLSNIEQYPKSFEKFYSDNYGFRQELILANKFLLDDVLNVDSISSKVLVGKNNWLYTTEYGALKDYQGILKYNPELLEKLLNLLISEYREAQKNGLKYLFVVVPDKHTIYPEYLPDIIQKYKTKNDTLLDQLIKEMRKIEPDFPILDLRKAMLKAKKNDIIYLQSDTHWNLIGAYYGYRAIVKSLGEKPISLSKFDKKQEIVDFGNLAEMIKKNIKYKNYYLEYKKEPKFNLVTKNNSKNVFNDLWGLPLDKEIGRHSFFEYKNPEKTLNLLMFRDSYTDNLMNFLPNNFNQSIFIWLYPCKIRFDLAKKQGINVVIREVAETRAGLQILRCE